MKIEIEIDDESAAKMAKAIRRLSPDESEQFLNGKTDEEITRAVFQNLADNHEIHCFSALPRRLDELKQLFP